MLKRILCLLFISSFLLIGQVYSQEGEKGSKFRVEFRAYSGTNDRVDIGEDEELEPLSQIKTGQGTSGRFDALLQ